MTVQVDHEVTATAPVNIAVVKYWGKRDEALLLPTNASLSGTLAQAHLRSKTTVRAIASSDSASDDKLWINGRAEDTRAPRVRSVLAAVRVLRREKEAADPALPRLAARALRIASENNFPTAAGLASSASGFAALVFALCELYALGLPAADMSRLARAGSGSACRSLMGGFVAWERGDRSDGSDSCAVQVAPRAHWPEIAVLVLVASAARKATPSSAGMRASVETSELLKHRIAAVVPQRMERMKRAIAARDFDAFAEETMRDSNQFHAVCLDTFPPIFYMNDVSRAVVRVVTEYNRACMARGEGYAAAYTFDAGPNAVLYTTQDKIPALLGLVDAFFPVGRDTDKEAYYGRAASAKSGPVDPAIESELRAAGVAPMPADSLTRIIYTELGDGPQVLARGHDAGVSLLDENGLPR